MPTTHSDNETHRLQCLTLVFTGGRWRKRRLLLSCFRYLVLYSFCGDWLHSTLRQIYHDCVVDRVDVLRNWRHYWRIQESLANSKVSARQRCTLDWIGLCSVLRPHQHSIGYMGDGFYRSKDPTNSIKVLKDGAHMKDHREEIYGKSAQGT